MSDNDNGKHELCREVGRCHAVIMQQEQIIAVLRAEVRAARLLGDASPLALEYCKQQWLDAVRATDAAKALEES